MVALARVEGVTTAAAIKERYLGAALFKLQRFITKSGVASINA
jgi:hypothetical protein